MVAVPELVNAGNVLATAAGGGVRLDVDPLLVALVAEHGQEIGSNANGSWIRFANGVQICWHQDSTATATTTQTVAPFWNTGAIALTFPQAFVATPVVIPSSRSGAANFGLGAVVIAASTTGCSLRGYGLNNQQAIRAGYIAVGRWA